MVQGGGGGRTKRIETKLSSEEHNICSFFFPHELSSSTNSIFGNCMIVNRYLIIHFNAYKKKKNK